MGSETYTTKAIKNLKKRMEKEGYEYDKKLSDVDYSPKQPFSSLNYRAGDKITRRSQTGILLYLNSAPIIWYSKRVILSPA